MAETKTVAKKKGKIFEKTLLNPISKAFVPLIPGFNALFALA